MKLNELDALMMSIDELKMALSLYENSSASDVRQAMKNGRLIARLRKDLKVWRLVRPVKGYGVPCVCVKRRGYGGCRVCKEIKL